MCNGIIGEIFFRLDGGSYRLESGVSAREYPMCDDTFTTRVATNMQGYKKVINLLEY